MRWVDVGERYLVIKKYAERIAIEVAHECVLSPVNVDSELGRATNLQGLYEAINAGDMLALPDLQHLAKAGTKSEHRCRTADTRLQCPIKERLLIRHGEGVRVYQLLH